MRITRVRTFHCGRTILVVFLEDRKILFRLRLTERGMKSLLSQLLPTALRFAHQK